MANYIRRILIWKGLAFPERHSGDGAQTPAGNICNVATLSAQPGGYCRRHSQAFLQLQLEENDRDLTTFFWDRVKRYDKGDYNTTEEVICYRFTRLPFGLTCSPFLISASVRELANRHKDSFPFGGRSCGPQPLHGWLCRGCGGRQRCHYHLLSTWRTHAKI